MDAKRSVNPCDFDLLKNYMPHILEKIFLSLDYESYKNCMKVNNTWKNLLTSESYQRKAKALFHDQLLEDEVKLWWAAKEGKGKRIRRLLSNGMLNVNCSVNGSTPLFRAIISTLTYGHKSDCVKLLLEKGADPNKANGADITPLCMAAFHGMTNVVKLLLDRGADQNKRRLTPLHYAVMLGHKDVVTMLLNAGADPNLRDHTGQTPLHNALELGDRDVIQELLAGAVIMTDELLRQLQ